MPVAVRRVNRRAVREKPVNLRIRLRRVGVSCSALVASRKTGFAVESTGDETIREGIENPPVSRNENPSKNKQNKQFLMVKRLCRMMARSVVGSRLEADNYEWPLELDRKVPAISEIRLQQTGGTTTSRVSGDKAVSTRVSCDGQENFIQRLFTFLTSQKTKIPGLALATRDRLALVQESTHSRRLLLIQDGF